jgi:hypothetical protein
MIIKISVALWDQKLLVITMLMAMWTTVIAVNLYSITSLIIVIGHYDKTFITGITKVWLTLALREKGNLHRPNQA